MSDSNKWSQEKMYCPNCGKIVVGYKNESDIIKMRCDYCGVILISKHKSRRRIDIQVHQQ